MFIYYISNWLSGSVGKRRRHSRPRPGFESQVCLVSYIILQIVFPCSVQDKNVPCILKNQQPRVPWDQAKGEDWESTMNVSQHCCTLPCKSQKGPLLIGPAFTITPPIWGLLPPLVCNLLHLLFFFLIFNCCFICFFTLLI